MTVRKVPGALILGLLASLAAHAGIFGGGHAMGGSYHGLLLDVALAGLCGLIALLGALACGSAVGAADGTILAARLRERLPGAGAVLIAAGFWFVLGESIEPGHAAAPLPVLIAALVAAACAFAWLARAITASLTRAVLVVVRTGFSPRTPSWQRRARGTPTPRRPILTRRRFARPPPIATFDCA